MDKNLSAFLFFAAIAIATALTASLVILRYSIVIAGVYYFFCLLFTVVAFAFFGEYTSDKDREIICFWARLFRKIGLRKLAAWYVGIPEKRIQKLLNDK